MESVIRTILDLESPLTPCEKCSNSSAAMTGPSSISAISLGGQHSWFLGGGQGGANGLQ